MCLLRAALTPSQQLTFAELLRDAADEIDLGESERRLKPTTMRRPLMVLHHVGHDGLGRRLFRV
jgi:hypothetical protein